MSQNRQTTKDRLVAEQDYSLNCRSDEGAKAILKHMAYHDQLMLQVLHRLEAFVPAGSAPASPAAETPPAG